LDFSVHGTKVVQASIPKLLYCNLIVYFFAQFWLFIKRFETVKMLKLLAEIDEKLLELKVNFDYKNQSKKIVKSLLCSVIFVALLVLYGGASVSFYKLPIDSKFPLIQLYGFMCCIVILHHFSLGMIGIKERFEKLNELMEESPHLIDIHHIRKFTEIHYKICNLIKAYNNVYGGIMIVMAGIAFLWFCLFMFLIGTGTSKFLQDYILIAILQLFTNIILFGIFFAQLRMAENIKNEGKSTKNILYKILHKIDDFRQRAIIESFIYQIDHNKIEISTGFFDFNLQFMFKVNLINFKIPEFFTHKYF
jgi:hypothetical protein